MSDSSKRAREDPAKFVSAHHEKAEMSWEQERKLRLSCEFRHLRYRHVDDLVVVIQKICQSDTTNKANTALVDLLKAFSKRDNLDPARIPSVGLSQEQKLYAERISDDPGKLRSRYPGDLAQIIESLVQQKFSTEPIVTKELQRINIAQSEARKKLR